MASPVRQSPSLARMQSRRDQSPFAQQYQQAKDETPEMANYYIAYHVLRKAVDKITETQSSTDERTVRFTRILEHELLKVNRFVDLRIISNLTLIFQPNDQTLEGSFSAVSTPIFATKYSFCSVFRDLQDFQSFAPIVIEIFRKNLQTFSHFCLNFYKNPYLN